MLDNAKVYRWLIVVGWLAPLPLFWQSMPTYKFSPAELATVSLSSALFAGAMSLGDCIAAIGLFFFIRPARILLVAVQLSLVINAAFIASGEPLPVPPSPYRPSFLVHVIISLAGMAQYAVVALTFTEGIGARFNRGSPSRG